MVQRPAILIHGPTASGKTALAVDLACSLGGEIINADSMQVYADLEILTARPDHKERESAPHHMFGHINADDVYSVGRWLADTKSTISEIKSRGNLPIIVGGTGLYLNALVEGLAQIPEIPEEIKQKARERVGADRNAAYDELAKIDPQAVTRIAKGDRQRIARALEVWMATGKTMSSFRKAAVPTISPGTFVGVTLTPKRDELYDRINQRVTNMVDMGALEEAKKLWQRDLPRDLPAMRAHGMPGLCDHFEGKLGLSEALDLCRRDTRRYAKRQMTWIAHQLTLWPRIPATNLSTRAKVISTLHEAIDRAAE